jgi:hypothetical protein
MRRNQWFSALSVPAARLMSALLRSDIRLVHAEQRINISPRSLGFIPSLTRYFVYQISKVGQALQLCVQFQQRDFIVIYYELSSCLNDRKSSRLPFKLIKYLHRIREVCFIQSQSVHNLLDYFSNSSSTFAEFKKSVLFESQSADELNRTEKWMTRNTYHLG